MRANRTASRGVTWLASTSCAPCRMQRRASAIPSPASRLRMAAAMDHFVDGPTGTDVVSESSQDLGRLMVTADVKPGQPLRLIKLIAYGWSAQRSTSAVRDQVAAALQGARHRGWDGL